MRLLNTTTLQLRDFMGEPPHYVILSHTWGEEEVTFDDICKPREQLQQMQGFDKILRSCELAKQDGFEWIWVDTCCIDKKSSVELSEAINSMYRWYWDAVVCYAYLVDVHNSGKTFAKSRWFKRGWTLQELLAPPIVEFYDSSWSMLGTRLSLVDGIERATGIDGIYLLDRHEIVNASIAARFSWASRRKTTRQEDIAYCLLGLVNVNMPMLYGEKEKAFYRLQLEIVKQSDDHTIFAWQLPNQEERGSSFALRPVRELLGSVFAPSPEYFKDSSGLYMLGNRPRDCATHEVVNGKLRITLPSYQISHDEDLFLLDCANERGTVALPLFRMRGGSYVRNLESLLVFYSRKDNPYAAEELADLLIQAHDPVAMRVQRDHEAGCIRITATGNAIRSNEFVINHITDGYRWSGIMDEPFFLNSGDFASFSVSFANARVGMVRNQPVLELYSEKRSNTGMTSLSRHKSRRRRRTESRNTDISRRAIAATILPDRAELTKSHLFEGLWRTEHIALQARKTRLDDQLCWTVKVTASIVDVPHQGQNQQVADDSVDRSLEEEEEEALLLASQHQR